MADLITRLGLRTSTNALTSTLNIPNYAPHFVIANFLLSYVVTATRGLKIGMGIDRNVSPRYDISTHGEAAVKEGKISRADLDRVKRLQSAHENSVEHFPFFVGAVCMATAAGMDNAVINRYSLAYTTIRIAYVLAYYYIVDHKTSYARSVLWWAGNITCIRLFWFAGKALNAAKFV